jgi:hypothetical protein
LVNPDHAELWRLHPRIHLGAEDIVDLFFNSRDHQSIPDTLLSWP